MEVKASPGDDNARRAVGIGVVVAAVSLFFCYVSIEGLATGRTLVIGKYNSTVAFGTKALVVALSYAALAVATGAFAIACFSASSHVQARLSRWAKWMAIAGGVLFFAALLLR